MEDSALGLLCYVSSLTRISFEESFKTNIILGSNTPSVKTWISSKSPLLWQIQAKQVSLCLRCEGKLECTES